MDNRNSNSNRGRGCQGRGNGSGRGRGCWNNNKRRGKGHNSDSKHFKGACKDIEDSVFVINRANAADRYNKSLEAISNYIGREYKFGRDIQQSIEMMEVITVDMPQKKSGTTFTADEVEWMFKEDYKEYKQRILILSKNISKLHALVYGQCDEVLKTKLNSNADYIDSNERKDGILLLKAINQLVHKQEDTRYFCETYVKCIRSIVNFRQEKDTSLSDYLKQFQRRVESAESYGVELGTDNIVLNHLEDYEHRDICADLASLKTQKTEADGKVVDKKGDELEVLQESIVAIQEWVEERDAYKQEGKEMVHVYIFFRGADKD